MNRRRIASLITAWIVPGLMVMAWEFVVRSGLVPPSQSAAPARVFVRITELVWSGVLILHSFYSVARLLSGVLVGGSVAVFTSIALANLPVADRVFSKVIQVFAGVPIVLWMPFCVMFFGTGELFKVSLIAISAFLLVHASTFQAIRTIEKDYIELADVYEKSFGQKLRDVLLPFAGAAISTSIRAAFALGWIVLFFVEYASSKEGQEGLGWFIADSRSVGRIEEEFAGLIVLAAIALVVDSIIALAQRHYLRWSDSLEILLETRHG